MAIRTSPLGHERRFSDVRDESASPPSPDVLRRRNEPTRWAPSGLMHRSKSKRGSATAIVALGKRFGRGTLALVLQTTKPPTEAARNFKSDWVGLGRPVRPV